MHSHFAHDDIAADCSRVALCVVAALFDFPSVLLLFWLGAAQNLVVADPLEKTVVGSKVVISFYR